MQIPRAPLQPLMLGEQMSALGSLGDLGPLPPPLEFSQLWGPVLTP